ncbi:hypothetical protein CALCODRAFT_505079 [Calocera cornea HHB12733]|uniref:F-box domain-containing protein n=1 Tax=Calocera cornea HHB12733 TaxID=1353952 RepID=A0A165C109_9BASI|nr:hypothetical protein CALCODRAFT_505079 [Calocera cornea HHB12733]
MHRLWTIPELTSAICDNLSEDIGSLASLATTCRLISSLSQCVLWRYVDRRSFAVLVDLSDPASRHFPCSIAQRKKRFDALSHHVHTIDLCDHPIGGLNPLHDSTYNRLCYAWSSRDTPLSPLFPSLRHLSVLAGTTRDLEAAQLLFHKDLHTFSLELNPLETWHGDEDIMTSASQVFESAFISLLGRLSQGSDTLTSLTLLLDTFISNALSPALSSLLSGFPNLQKFEADRGMFTEPVLRHVGNLKNLRHVWYQCAYADSTPPGMSLTLTPTTPWFSSLRSVRLDHGFQDALSVLKLISGPLEHLYLGFALDDLVDPDVRQISRDASSFAATLREFELDATYAAQENPDHYPTWDSFASLYACRWLETLSLHLIGPAGRSTILGDSDIRPIAENWPRLKRFKLLWHPRADRFHFISTEGPRNFSLYGLLHLYALCPHLHTVTLSAVVVPAALPKPPTFDRGTICEQSGGRRALYLDMERLKWKDDSALPQLAAYLGGSAGLPPLTLRPHRPVDGILQDHWFASYSPADLRKKLEKVNAMASAVAWFARLRVSQKTLTFPAA